MIAAWRCAFAVVLEQRIERLRSGIAYAQRWRDTIILMGGISADEFAADMALRQQQLLALERESRQSDTAEVSR